MNCNTKVKDPKKKDAFISLREAYPKLDCYYQIIDLDKDVLWEAGYFERENTSPNPMTNLTSETKYTIESTKIPVPTGPFKDNANKKKQDKAYLKVSLEGSGMVKEISHEPKMESQVSAKEKQFETPNATRIMLEINNFPYANKKSDWKEKSDFRHSKLAIATFFGSSGKTDNKVVYKTGSKITLTQGGSGKKMGYYNWGEYALNDDKWLKVSSNCAIDDTSLSANDDKDDLSNKRKFCGNFMHAKNLNDIAFGQLKAQVQPTPIEKTIYTYFTLGDGGVTRDKYPKDPKSIKWEIMMGLGDAPIQPDDPRVFMYVMITILVIGCCLCIVREKYDEKDGKRWGYPPNFEFAVIGHDTLGGANDNIITLAFDEAIYENDNIDVRDFEVICHKEKPCLEYNQHLGRFCKCVQAAIDAKKKNAGDDILYGKVNIKSAKVHFTPDEHTSMFRQIEKKPKLHGTVQLTLADKWTHDKTKRTVEVLEQAKMITVAYTRQITDVEKSKVMNFSNLRHLRNICLHGDVMNSIRLCCGWEEDEVTLQHKSGANPCISDAAGNSVKSFVGKKVYNFIGLDNVEDYERKSVIVLDKKLKKQRNLSVYSELEKFDKWNELISDDLDGADDAKEETKEQRKKSNNREKEVAMQDVEKNSDDDDDDDENENERSSLIKKDT